MSNKIGKTTTAFTRLWYNVDLSRDSRTLGRLASQIAVTLMGKHKPIYHPTTDIGDYVVVSNCQHLKLSGKKVKDKSYWSHTGRPGSGKSTPVLKIIEDHGYGEILRKAVSRMLPKNKLRKQRLQRLRVFDSSEHPYKQNLVAFADQQPDVRKKIKFLEDAK
ncbi:54S ribosomal protein L23, mitochondrial [Komagataella kurtzmanii]|nr:54S ribosomal protein L23, mitochondrial [Komagataella kurtzmanii]